MRKAWLSLLFVVLAVLASGQVFAQGTCWTENGQTHCSGSGISVGSPYGPPLPLSYLPQNYMLDRTTTSILRARCIGPYANSPGCPGYKPTSGQASCREGLEWSNAEQRCVYPAATTDTPARDGEPEDGGTIGDAKVKDVKKGNTAVADNKTYCRPETIGGPGVVTPIFTALAATAA